MPPTPSRTSGAARPDASVASSTSSTTWAGSAIAAVTSSSSPPTARPRLTPSTGVCLAPAWSPDGARIVFDSARHEHWDIDLRRDLYLVSPQGGEPERLTSLDGWYEAPSWSSDGALIACRWEPGGFDYPRHGQIAVVDAESGKRRVLTQTLD
ncbi:MAG: hypothetical protein C4305_04250, partial [Thermoleophilia bacterium]